MNGEKKTGITIMQTVLKVDAGDMYLQREIDIEQTDTSSSVFNKLATLGVECLKEFFNRFDYYINNPIKQDESEMTYFPMIKKEDYLINFLVSSEELYNKIRALENCYFIYHGLRYKVLSSKIVFEKGIAGKILKADNKNGLIIATQDNAIEILTIQPEGKPKMDAKAYMNSNKFKVGDIINNS